MGHRCVASRGERYSRCRSALWPCAGHQNKNDAAPLAISQLETKTVLHVQAHGSSDDFASESLPLLPQPPITYGAQERRVCPPHPYYDVPTTTATATEASWQQPFVATALWMHLKRPLAQSSVTSTEAAGAPPSLQLPSPPLLLFCSAADELEEEFRGDVAAWDIRHDIEGKTEEEKENEVGLTLPLPPAAKAPTEGVSNEAPSGRLQPLSPNRTSPSRHLTTTAASSTPGTQGLQDCATKLWRVPTSHSKPAATPKPARVPLRLSSERAFAVDKPSSTTPVRPRAALSKSGRNTPTPALSTEGGEDVTTAKESLQVQVEMHRAELAQAQAELNAVLKATADAEANRRRVTDEVANIERYKATLDGVVAFTLRELEDAAAGVEEAEAEMRRESAAALRRLVAAQEGLQQLSLR